MMIGLTQEECSAFGWGKVLHPDDAEAAMAVESSGVGLAIVKKAVESQRGAITLISAPGQGSTFRFTWPVDTVLTQS